MVELVVAMLAHHQAQAMQWPERSHRPAPTPRTKMSADFNDKKIFIKCKEDIRIASFISSSFQAFLSEMHQIEFGQK